MAPPASGTAAPEAPEPAAPPKGPWPETPPTLLFVDDEPNILSALSRLFRPEGYHILTAEGGAQGLELLAAEPVDLVISDMRMPEMDGARFLAQVAERWPDTVRVLLTGHADLESAVQAINDGRIYRYLSKPWDDQGIRLDVRHALERKFLEDERRRLEALTQRQNAELKDLNANLEHKVAERTAELKRALDLLKQAHADLNDAYVDAIKVFANVIEMRPGRTRGRARQIAEGGYRLARHLGQSESEAQDVLFAGLLHDIGKLGLPEPLASRRLDRLEGVDRERVKMHPVAGQAALLALEPLRNAALLVRHQCERFNGSGWPDALAGERIPLGARILAVVIDYYGLQDGRVLDRRLDPHAALTYLTRGRGSLYDPQVVASWTQLMDAEAGAPAPEPELRVEPRDLRPGMVLARDVMSSGSIVWLTRGQVLNERLIQRIREIASATGGVTLFVRMEKLA